MPNTPSSRPTRRTAATQHPLAGTSVITTADKDACRKAALMALARALGRQAAEEAWEAQRAQRTRKDSDHD